METFNLSGYDPTASIKLTEDTGAQTVYGIRNDKPVSFRFVFANGEEAKYDKASSMADLFCQMTQYFEYRKTKNLLFEGLFAGVVLCGLSFLAGYLVGVVG